MKFAKVPAGATQEEIDACCLWAIQQMNQNQFHKIFGRFLRGDGHVIFYAPFYSGAKAVSKMMKQKILANILGEI